MVDFLKRFRRYLLLLLITFTALFIIYKQGRLVFSNKKNKQQTYTVVATNLENYITLSGTVDAEEKSTLQFQTSGLLAWVGVKEGDRVNKWQAIASLDQRELKKTLEKRLNDYLSSRWDYEQTKEDYKSKYTGSGNTYLTDEITRIAEKSQFGLNKAVLDVEIANLTLELSTIVSPIEGIVTNIDQPVAGVNITPATARFEIVNPDTLYLSAIVDQQDVVKLKNNMQTKIVFDSYPNQTYQGKIYYISFAPAPGEEGSYIVKTTLPKSILPKLRLGMGAEINILVTSKKNVLAIPFSAISEEKNKSYVFVLENGRRVKKEVVLGVEGEDLIEVKRGLQEGQVVVY